MKRKSLRNIIISIIILVVIVPVSFMIHRAGSYYYFLSKFESSVKGGDLLSARQEFENLKYYFQKSRKWGTGILADTFLFEDAWLHDAYYFYVMEDYKTVIDKLQDINDHRAKNLLGVTLFRLAQAEYKKGDEEVRNETIRKVVNEINSMFESAVKEGPEDYFDYKWNYDLTAEEEKVVQALTEELELDLNINPVPTGKHDDESKIKGDERELGTIREEKVNDGESKRRKEG